MEDDERHMNMNIVEPDYLRTSTELTIQSVPPNPHFLEFQIENFQVKNPKEVVDAEVFFMGQLENRFEDYQKLVRIMVMQKNKNLNQENENVNANHEGLNLLNKKFNFAECDMTIEQQEEIEIIFSDLKFLWDLVKDIRKEAKTQTTEGELKVVQFSDNEGFEVHLLKDEKLKEFQILKKQIEENNKTQQGNITETKPKKLDLLKKESMTKNKQFKVLFPNLNSKSKDVYFQIKSDEELLFESEVFDSSLEKYPRSVELHVARYYPLDHLEIVLSKKGIFGGKILQEKVNVNEQVLRRSYKNSVIVKKHFQSLPTHEGNNENQKLIKKSQNSNNTHNNKTNTKEESEENTRTKETTGNTGITGNTKTTENTGTTGNTNTTGQTNESDPTQQTSTHGNTQETGTKTVEDPSKGDIVKIDIESPEEKMISDWLENYEVSDALKNRIKSGLTIPKTLIEFDYSIKIEHLYELDENTKEPNPKTNELNLDFEKYINIGQKCTHINDESDSMRNYEYNQKLKQCVICQAMKESINKHGRGDMETNRYASGSTLNNKFFDHWFPNRNLCDPRRFVLEFAKKEGIEALLLDSKKLKNFFRISNKSLKEEILNKIKTNHNKSKFIVFITLRKSNHPMEKLRNHKIKRTHKNPKISTGRTKHSKRPTSTWPPNM
jgi:hypothetical protein